MGPGQRRAALLLIAVISVNASYTVLIPFVPDLEDRVGAGPAVIALTFALFAAAKSLFQPVGGWWVDRWRADRVACLALLVAAVGIVMTALARDSVTLLAGRLCWGVGEGMVTPALYTGMASLCHRYSIPSSRMMGNFGSAAVAGFLLGPLIAGVAAPFGLEALFLAGAAVTAATALGLLRAIPARPAPPDAEDAEDAEDAGDTGEAGAAASRSGIPERGTGRGGPQRWWVWILVLGLLDMFTFLIYSALEPVLPLHLSAAHDGSARTAISVVFVIGLAASGLSMWALGRWAERLRLITMIRVGLAFLAVGLTGMATSAAVVPVGGWFLVFMFGYAALFLTTRRAIVELRSATASQGKAFGLFGLVSDIGNVLGPVIGVVLYEATGALSFVVMGALSGLLLATSAATLGRKGSFLARPRTPSRAAPVASAAAEEEPDPAGVG